MRGYKIFILVLLACLSRSDVWAEDPFPGTRRDYSVGRHPTAVISVDFDGDGNPALVTADSAGNTISVLRNTGIGGVFTDRVELLSGQYPASICSADFNNDGLPDLAVANSGSANISILTYNGDGTFATAVYYPAGVNPGSLCSADFNGDGAPDLAVANRSISYVTVLINNGDGSFATGVSYSMGPLSHRPRSIAAADFDGGGADLVVGAETGQVVTLRNHGDGTFEAYRYLTNFGEKPTVCVLDIYGTGGIGLAVASYMWADITVLENASAPGNIRFKAPGKTFTLDLPPTSMCAIDFNQDGKDDLATVQGDLHNIMIMKNESSLGLIDFAAPVIYRTGLAPSAICVVDAESDGWPDLATANFYSHTVSVLKNDGLGSVIAPDEYVATSASGELSSLCAADFNGDGMRDLAVAVENGNRVSVMMNDGDGGFPARVSYILGTDTHPRSITSADFDGDGTFDLAVANYNAASLSILLNTGDGTFASAVNYGVAPEPVFVLCRDMDEDDIPDLVTANWSGGISILRGNGDGTFAAVVSIGLGGNPAALYAADYDNDGRRDLAVAKSNLNNGLSILINTGSTGTISFADPVNYDVGRYPVSLFSDDFDNDGARDLAVAMDRDSAIVIMRNTGDGTFVVEGSYRVWPTPSRVYGADFDGDGKRDLAAMALAGNNISILKNIGGGAFAPMTNYAYGAGVLPADACIADFTNNGKPDLAVASSSVNFVTVLDGVLSASNQYTITAITEGNGSIDPSGEIIHDFDEDQSVTITPDIGHHIVDVLVDGVSVGPITNYKFRSIIANHTIDATFAVDTFVITASAEANGTMTPEGAITVNYGDDQTFFITPDAGYRVVDVIVDGDSEGARDSYTFAHITGNHTISATFSDQCTITSGNSGGGTIDPKGSISVPVGADQTFTFTPNEGYHLEMVTADSWVVEVDSEYTFTNVTADHTIYASFASNMYFMSAVNYAVGTGPYSVYAADLDGDTKIDLAVANYYLGNVQVLKNNGSGSFASSGVYTAGTYPASVFAADFDGDGRRDLAVANYGSNTVSVFKNNGSGTFGAAVNYTVGSRPASVCADDYNGDGKLDLAVANFGSRQVTVLRNNSSVGSISFAAGVNYMADAGPRSVCAADVDGDGKKDLAIANDSAHTVLVWRNTGVAGNISFGSPAAYPAGLNPRSICAADFDGDGMPDLAVANAGLTGFSTLKNSGTGAFLPPVTNYVAGATYSICAADFSGDGIPDIAVTKYFFNNIRVLRGNGDGTFMTQAEVPAGTNPISIYPADLNGDYKPDLAVANFSSNNVSVLMNYSEWEYAITATAGASGSITPSGSVAVPFGADQAFYIAPNTGYHIADVLVDGVSVGPVDHYLFSFVSADHDISATFEINQYPITATAGEHGVISPAGTVMVNHGAGQSFTITPGVGYHVGDVLVDGASVGPVTNFNFEDVTASHTIAAAFAINMYTVLASAGDNGTIAPSGPVAVSHGADTVFEITPDANYHVADVLVDGISVGAVTADTIKNVTANHSIEASFAIDTYTITASAGENGQILPNGTVIVNHGADQVFNIVPSAGHHIVDVLVDSVSVGALEVDTIQNVTANHTISAGFAINTYTITVSAGPNGSITPNGAIVVNYDTDLNFTITPDTGYQVADVLVDGSSVGNVSAYLLPGIMDDHTISASFSLLLVAPQMTSTPPLSGNVGQLYVYDADATGVPAPIYRLAVSPTDMVIDSVTGLVQWTPVEVGDFNVSVKAVNEAGIYEQNYSIHVGDKICDFTPGDANGDGTINVGDAVFLINYIFKGGAAPDPLGSGDANCEGNVNIGDAVYLITYIFKGGPAPCCP